MWQVEIVTEFDVFKIPVTATVLAPDQDVFVEQPLHSVSLAHNMDQQASRPAAIGVPCEPTGPPPTEHVPPPEDTCRVVQDLLSWLERDTLGDVLIKGHR